MAPPRSSGFTDPGWEHGVSQDEKKKKVKCNYCGKIVSGGIYRLKQHLARISGEVTFCRKAPEEVCEKMKDNLEGSQAIKKHRRYNDGNQASFEMPSNDDNEEADETANFKGEKLEDASQKSLIPCSTPLRSLGYVDPGWEHGVAQDTRKKKVKCNYCEKIVSGGINRFKQHLARIPGEVAPCKMAPDQVYLKMKENMKWHRTGRKQLTDFELADFKLEDFKFEDSNNDEAGEELPNSEGNRMSQLFGDRISVFCKGRRRRCSSDLDHQAKALRSGTHPHKQSIRTENEKQSSQEVISAISKFFYHSGAPLDVADSPYFHKMLDMVRRSGPEWKCPSAQALSDQLLQEEMVSIKKNQMEMKASWMVSGCTIMMDRWNVAEDQNVVKLLVTSPQGTSFISSVEVSDFSQDPTRIFELMDRTVEEVGEENVVQVVTDISPAYAAAGRMLEEKRKNLFWTPCIGHSLDLVLKDFLSIKFLAECVSKAQRITCLLYNHRSLLDLTKEFTAGKELLHPARTQSLSTFLSLRCLLKHRNIFRRMFQSTKWATSRFAEADDGQQVEKITLDSTFWKKIQYITKLADPVVQFLLKLEDNGGISLGSIYESMNRAKLLIKEIHGGDERKYLPFLMIMDTHLHPLFHHPLLGAAYFLNPSLRYDLNFLLLPEVIQGVNECIARLEPISGRRISASMQIADFVSAKGELGTELAVSARKELNPVAWWQQHGTNCVELQRIAVRILSQRCCTGPTWSRLACKELNQNRLAQKFQTDLLFVHHNLNLQDGQLSYSGPHQIFLDRLLDDWLREPDARPLQEQDEEIVGIYKEKADGEMSGAAFPEIVEPLEFQQGVDCGVPSDDDPTADIDFFGDG